MDNSKLEIISDIVDSLPNVLLNIKSLNLLNVLKGQFVSNSSFWFQTFATHDEDVLLVKLANTEALPWFFKVG